VWLHQSPHLKLVWLRVDLPSSSNCKTHKYTIGHCLIISIGKFQKVK
jgi:hypothetical protein